MTPKDEPGEESEAERFRKNLAALIAVPKSEIEGTKAKRPKRAPKTPKR